MQTARSSDIVALYSAIPTHMSRMGSPSGSMLAYEMGVWQEADKRFLHVLMVNSSNTPSPADQADKIARLAQSGLYGFVITDFGHGDEGLPDLLSALREYDVPTVAIGSTAALDNTDRVLHDHTDGTQQLTRYCLERGCHRPLVVWNEPITGYWYKQRLQGYENVLREAGLPVQAPLVMPDMPMATAEDFAHAADRLAQGLKPYLNGPEPVDALLVGSDDFAPVSGAALKLLGRQPNSDVLIAGYDNTWPDIFCRQFDNTIPIATIDKDNWGQGEELMRLLCQRVEGELPPEPQARLFAGTLLLPEAALAATV